jgi:hypothetical protein
MNASRFSPLSRGASVQVRSEIVWWSRRYCAFSAFGRELPLRRLFRLLRLRRRCRCVRLGPLDRLAGRLDGGDDDRDIAALRVPGQDMLRRIPTSRACLIRSRSLRCDRPTLKE